MILWGPNRLLERVGGQRGWPLAGVQTAEGKSRVVNDSVLLASRRGGDSTPSRFAERASNKGDKTHICSTCLQTRRRIQSGVYRGCARIKRGYIQTEGNVCRSCQSRGVLLTQHSPTKARSPPSSATQKRRRTQARTTRVVSTAVDGCLLLHDFDSLPTVGQLQGCWRTSSISLSRQFKDRVCVVFEREKRRKK